MSEIKTEMDIAIDAEVLEEFVRMKQVMHKNRQPVDPVKLMHICRTTICEKYGEEPPAPLPVKQSNMGSLVT